MKDRQKFLNRVAEIYASWPSDTYDVLELVDGTVLERFSKMRYIEGAELSAGSGASGISRPAGVPRKPYKKAWNVCVSWRRRFPSRYSPPRLTAKWIISTSNGWITRPYPGAISGLGEWMKLIHPEDMDGTLARWRHVLRTGEPFQTETSNPARRRRLSLASDPGSGQARRSTVIFRCG